MRLILTKYSFLFLFSIFLLTGLLVSKRYIDVVTHPQQLYVLLLTSLCVFTTGIFLIFNAYRTFRYQLVLLDFLIPLLGLLILYSGIKTYQEVNLSLLLAALTPLSYYVGVILKLQVEKGRLEVDSLAFIATIALFVYLTIGALQTTGVVRSLNNSFPLTGTFLNPGPYAIYLTMLFPNIVFYWGYSTKGLVVKVFLSIVLVLTIWILVRLESRSAWVAMGVYVVFYLNYRYKLLNKIIDYKRNLKRSLLKYPLILCLIVSSAIGLFRYKQDSAIGRTIIWQRTLAMITEKPLGYGYAQFPIAYNDYKAKLYASKEITMRNARFEGNVTYAFNDYLQFLHEYGAHLFVLLAIILVLTFYTSAKEDRESQQRYFSFKASLLILLITALFTYPLQVLPIKLLFFLFLGIVAGRTKALISFIPKKILTLLFSLLFVASAATLFSYTLEQNRAYVRWKQAYGLMRTNQPHRGILAYKEAYQHLSTDGFFLYSYATELQLLGQFQEAIMIMHEANTYINDEDVYMRLGELYEETGQYADAIANFHKASNIAPQLFYPPYRLVSLYYATGDEAKALKTARQLMNKPIKVPSPKIDNMRNETQEFIEWYNTDCYDK